MTNMYSLKDAAEQLGVSVPGIKHHLYKSGRLEGVGTVIGKSLVFTDDDIEAMRQVFESTVPGKPPQHAIDPAQFVAEHEQLERLARSQGDTAGAVRARAVLLMAADGAVQKDVAAQLGIAQNSVKHYLRRFAKGGANALRSKKRGRKKSE